MPPGVTDFVNCGIGCWYPFSFPVSHSSKRVGVSGSEKSVIIFQYAASVSCEGNVSAARYGPNPMSRKQNAKSVSLIFAMSVLRDSSTVGAVYDRPQF